MDYGCGAARGTAGMNELKGLNVLKVEGSRELVLRIVG